MEAIMLLMQNVCALESRPDAARPAMPKQSTGTARIGQHYVAQWFEREKEKRKARGEPRYTQEKLAAEADLTPSSISQILAGEQGISLGKLEAIAEAFGVRAADLLVPPDEAGRPPTQHQRRIMRALDQVEDADLEWAEPLILQLLEGAKSRRQ